MMDKEFLYLRLYMTFLVIYSSINDTITYCLQKRPSFKLVTSTVSNLSLQSTLFKKTPSWPAPTVYLREVSGLYRESLVTVE